MNKNKIFIGSGFSLAEALIVMFIICAVAAFATPAVTKLIKKRGQQAASGLYACYYDGSDLKEWYAGKAAEKVTQCTFKLNVRDNAYYLIKAVGGGNSKAPGQYVSTYIPRSDSELKITVGKADQINTAGDSVVESRTTKFGAGNDYEELIRALGSISTANDFLYENNVKSCMLRNAPAKCDEEEKKDKQSDCKVARRPSDGKLSFKISLCGTEEYVPIQDSSNGVTRDTTIRDAAGQEVKRGAYKKGNNSIAIEFKDTTFPNTEGSAKSGLVEELGANPTREILKKIKNIEAGNRGKPGAVLIQW